MVAMDVRVDLADLAAEHPLERNVGVLDQGHLEALLPGGGGHLRADPARPDDRDPSPLGEPRRDRVGVAEVAQVVHTG